MEEDWLSSFKEGDQVCYHSKYHGYVVETILKITPTGQIKTTGAKTFKNGVHRVDDWTRYDIEPITEKVMQSLERVELLEKIKRIDLSKLSNEKLKEVLKIVEE